MNVQHPKTEFEIRPKFIQLRDVLARRIDAGHYDRDRCLPSESALLREFGISSGTVRKAMNLLADGGFIVREPGRGTFIVDRIVREDRARSCYLRAVELFREATANPGNAGVFDAVVKIYARELAGARCDYTKQFPRDAIAAVPADLVAELLPIEGGAS